MWEVDWTDYTRETLDKRRERKEEEKEQKRREDARIGRASVSTRSSASSGDKQPGFFGSIGLKRSVNLQKNKNITPPSLRLAKDGGDKTPRDSTFVPSLSTVSTLPLSLSSMTSDEKSKFFGEGSFLGQIGSHWGESSDRSSKDSSLLSRVVEEKGAMLMPRPATNEAPACLASHVPKRYVDEGLVMTRTIEIISESRSESAGAASSEATIRADPVKSRAPTPPTSPGPKNLPPPVRQLELVPPDSPESPLSPVSPGVPGLHVESIYSLVNSGEKTNRRTGSTIQYGKLNCADMKSPKKAPRLHYTPIPRLSTRSSKLNADNPEAWKPPEAWNRCPTPEASSELVENLRRASEKEEKKANPAAMNLANVQREMQKMSAASHQIMLVRLTEEWGTAPEASFYQELEMEKKRWMLSAIYSLEKVTPEVRKMREETVSRPGKILALFETKGTYESLAVTANMDITDKTIATAAYLAALHSKIKIIHVAPLPLSHRLFPNISPIHSPTASNPAIPLASESFMTVYCHAMSSLVPSHEFPQLLRNVYRCLMPKGILHLVLIDPFPVASTVGPRMRAWLDQNLMINIETRFRCVSPIKLFPDWLKGAKLEGSESTWTEVQFMAVAPRSSSNSASATICSRDSMGETSVKAELQTVVGRMLWQEIWGPFVNAGAWWWQIPECVEECITFGTTWEYCLVDAVKKDG